MAKDLGLFGKKKDTAETQESKERTKAVGNLIRLRNLTEQRNNNKTKDWKLECFKSFIVPKSDKVKTIDTDSIGPYHVIDVNLWFKTNSLTPSNMNEIRQYIFEEWLHKKIVTSKTKVVSGSNLVVVYDSPTDPFIDLLKNKISEILEFEFCDIILMNE